MLIKFEKKFKWINRGEIILLKIQQESNLLKLSLILVILTVLFTISTNQSSAAVTNSGIATSSVPDNIVVNHNLNNYKNQVTVNKPTIQTKKAPTVDPVDLVVTKDVESFQPVWNYNTTNTFRITLGNNGPDPATGVTVTDTLPTGLVYDHAVTSTGSFDGTTMTWNVGNLAVGSVETLELYVNVTGHNTTVTNTVNAAANEAEVNPADNTASIDVTIPASADISVTKNFYYEDLGPIVFPDNPMDRYWKFFSEVIVTNNGPDDATNVRISDLLGPGMELAPFDQFGSWFVTYTGQNPDVDPPENNPSFNPNFSPTTMLWTIPSMKNGDIWVLDFFTVANTTGTVTNTATFNPATADQYDS